MFGSMLESVSHTCQITSFVLWGLALVLLLLGLLMLRQHRTRGVTSIAVAVVLALLGAGAYYAYAETKPKPHEVVTGTISLAGVERDHAGVRGDGLKYNTSVKVEQAPQIPLLDHNNPLNRAARTLAHETREVKGVIVVYSILKSGALESVKVVVDKTDHTVVVSLPEPTVDETTVYIDSVGGVKVAKGVANALAEAPAGVIKSLFGQPTEDFNPERMFDKAKNKALEQARGTEGNRLTKACGRPGIEDTLEPLLGQMYPGYKVSFGWPTPTPVGVRCGEVGHV
jgi:hypothetical protein